MATTILGLDNGKSLGETLSATTDWNALVDDAEWIAGGYLSLSAAGGAGDQTLTAAQYEINVLVLTGALTGNRNIIFPTTHSGRRWLVYNNTSGSFSLTMKTSAGTGVAITQGYAALVACDGTNIIRLGPDSAITSASSVAVTSPRVVTGINDTNGNELMKVTATASAVNEVTLTNAATGAGPILSATGDDANIDMTVRGKGTGGTQLSLSGGKLGFFGVAVAARAAALTQTYATADRTLAALTVGADIGAFTDPPSAAEMALLRTFVNALKADHADLAQFVNALADDLQTYGLEQ